MSIYLGTTIDAANKHGQQLYLANISWPLARIRHGEVRRPHGRAIRRTQPEAAEFYPSMQVQLTAFEMPRDLAVYANGPLPDPPNAKMAAFLDAAVLDHARRHGWSKTTTQRTQRSMRVLQLIQDSPGAMLLASNALQLLQIGLPVVPTIDVAIAAGVMIDDRQPAIHAWFATVTAGLPAPMQAELREWFEIMINGSHEPPRRRPREQQTIRNNLAWAKPALDTWAEQGHKSLREVTSADVRAVLPSSGNPRSTMGAGLRSILTLLKARKVIFVNPIARINTGRHEERDPLPAHAGKIRNALLSTNPACAALVALAAFHGLRAGELLRMRLTDISDGRLNLPKRTILLAEPVRVRITAWLNYRNRRWPHTANPHVFLNHRNANRTEPVGARWLTLATGIPVKVMREDRILNEARSTGGDVRRICYLFGLSFEAALRYVPDLDLEALTAHHAE